MDEEPLIFDTHAHYDDEKFDSDREDFLLTPQKHGVAGIVNVGGDLKSSKLGLDYSRKYSDVYCSVGVHPHEVHGLPDDYLDVLKELGSNEKVVAIGEIGLDYHSDSDSKKEQIKRFEEQLDLAARLNLPVIVHSRDACQDTMAVLANAKPMAFVVHCFSYEPETASDVLGMGGFLGFTGVLTFKNAEKIKEVLEEVPLERMLVETDCPYLAPEPFRGQRCDSGMLKFMVQAMVSVRRKSFKEMVTILNANAKRFYRITGE
ncbi:MAG: TatD family hydrolase [Oscillospiraceae bacterium]|jgi:TatD DNase family protein|nr:TatD family hydrolase [Oscillospiraceae bacterium]